MREGNVSRMADYEIPTLTLPPKIMIKSTITDEENSGKMMGYS